MTFKLGYAQSVITPDLTRPVYLAGFGQDRIARSIHDDLFVRVLALHQGGSTLALVSLDLIGFFRLDVMEVSKRVQAIHPDASIIISSSHTHHGPDTMGFWGSNSSTSGVDSTYMAVIKEKITSSILSALGQLADCDEVKSATIRTTGLVKNSRDPGVLDEELVIMQFSQNGKTLVTVFNFACHPEVLWDQNPQITSDYPGFVREEVEKATGSPCIFFPGALGGMLTPDVSEHSFEEAEQMGKTLAFTGLLALERTEIKMLQPSLEIKKTGLSVKLTNILYKIAFMRKLLPDARDKHGNVSSEINLIRIGEVWFATIPGELLPKLGLTLKADMIKAGAKIAGIIGLANDELGYILPKEEFRYPLNPFRPGKHYEETNSIGNEIGPKVLDAVRSLL